MMVAEIVMHGFPGWCKFRELFHDGCRDHYVYVPSQWDMSTQCNAVSHWLGAYTERDHSVYAPSQWEMALQCNAISHWLDAYTEWSLDGEVNTEKHRRNRENIIRIDSVGSYMMVVMKWRWFPHYWPFVRGIQLWPVDSHHKGSVMWSLMFSLVLVWTSWNTMMWLHCNKVTNWLTDWLTDFNWLTEMRWVIAWSRVMISWAQWLSEVLGFRHSLTKWYIFTW